MKEIYVKETTSFIIDYTKSIDKFWNHLNPECGGYFSGIDYLLDEMWYRHMFRNTKHRKYMLINSDNLDEKQNDELKSYYEILEHRYKRFAKYRFGFLKEERIKSKIKNILRNDWNPIGLHEHLPLDEYDSYVPKIYNILLEDASVDYVYETLKHIEVNVIGLKNINKDMNREKKVKIIANVLCNLKGDL